MGCIFLTFAKGVISVLFEVKRLVKENTQELVGCGRVDGVVYKVQWWAWDWSLFSLAVGVWFALVGHVEEGKFVDFEGGVV